MPRNNIIEFRWTVLNVAPLAMNNNNNNRGGVHVMQIRDRMFRVMFIRLAVLYAAHFPEKARKMIENVILFGCILSFLGLSFTHSMFIHSPMSCLDSLHEEWPKDGILRVEVIHNNNSGKPYTLEDSYRKEVMIRRFQAMDQTMVPNLFDWNDPKYNPEKKSSANSDASQTALPILKGIERIPDDASEDFISHYLSDLFDSADDDDAVNQSNDMQEASSELPEVELHVAVKPPNATASEGSQFTDPMNNTIDKLEEICIECIADSYIVEYSLEYGYLKLSAKARRLLKVPTKMIVLDSSTNKCFGNWLTRFFLDYIVGYDEVLLSSVSRLASKVGSKGFIRNVVKDHYFRFVNVMGHASYAFAAFIMFVFTFSISTLLRYAHHQIFLFIVQLLRMFEFRSTVTIQAAPLLTVILSLVGMEAIMSEFFSDPTTSFYVIMIVWVADQYDAICCRTTISRRHWLRFFYLYHFAFYAYEYRFSGQYSNLALFTSCCFIFHSMLYFFHHYELPVIMRFVSRVNGTRRHRVRQPPRDPEPPDAEPSAEAPNEESSSSSSSGAINLNDARLDSMDISDSTSDESSRNQEDDEFDEFTPGSSDSPADGPNSISPIPHVTDDGIGGGDNQSESPSPTRTVIVGVGNPSNRDSRSPETTPSPDRPQIIMREHRTSCCPHGCRRIEIKLVRLQVAEEQPNEALRTAPMNPPSTENREQSPVNGTSCTCRSPIGQEKPIGATSNVSITK